MQKIDLIKQDYASGCWNEDEEQWELQLEVMEHDTIPMYVRIRDQGNGPWWNAYLVSAEHLDRVGQYYLIYKEC